MASSPVQQVVYDQVNHFIGLQDSQDNKEDAAHYLAILALRGEITGDIVKYAEKYNNETLDMGLTVKKGVVSPTMQSDLRKFFQTNEDFKYLYKWVDNALYERINDCHRKVQKFLRELLKTHFLEAIFQHNTPIA